MIRWESIELQKKFEADLRKSMQVIHDKWDKFTGFVVSHLLNVLNIKSVPTTNKNPQPVAAESVNTNETSTFAESWVCTSCGCFQPPLSIFPCHLLVERGKPLY